MASSSAAGGSGKKYDVFISFRGSDVRQGFLSHLLKALLDQDVEAFVDDQLERGEDISESLMRTIEESRIAIVLFSHNYADSRCCLEELSKITECRHETGLRVIPVFYCVDPSHVQDLSWRYGGAMDQHRTKFDESLVQSWANALRETAFLSGLDSSNFKTESELLEKMIVLTLEMLNQSDQSPSASAWDDGLVGIDARVDKIKSLLSGAQNLCILGIWGEGGLGKTTIAQATYDQMSSEFDIQCFVKNIREKSEKFTTDAIQKEVDSKLLGTSNSGMTRKRLSRKKVILVLDEVSDLDQIESIVRYKFASGSLIIVTSRDRQLLENLGAKVYAVEKLNYSEALELFCLKAFKRKVPQDGYSELCKRAVEYAQGLPLALEALGSNLLQRNKSLWEDELKKVKGSSNDKIQRILRISYDGLPNEEKEIFLDIACLFRGRQRDEVESLLDVHGPKIGISRLVDKALISIRFNCIEMHDLIQQMAKDVICEDKSLKNRRWLWDPVDVYVLLKRETGTAAVRGITLDISQIKNIDLKPTAFDRLYDIRYLNFYAFRDSVQLFAPQGLQNLPLKLRYLNWDRYSSVSFHVIRFWAENLVELNMRDSQLEELCIESECLLNLKMLDLSGSAMLIGIRNLSTASKLESLILNNCTSLVEIPSLEYLDKLTILELSNCSSLESLPGNISYLKNLVLLDISYCENLRGLPQTFGELRSLKEFKAGSSGLEELPESFCNLMELESLVIEKCVNLHRLPQKLGNLISLKELLARESGIVELPESTCSLKACKTLDVRKCVLLHDLPQNIGNLKSLQYLHADGSGIDNVPSSINYLRELRKLTFSGCKGLMLPPLTGDFPHLTLVDLGNCDISEFPVGLCSVKSLIDLSLSGNCFENIPESIENLTKLQYFVLYSCMKLKYVPESLNLLRLVGYFDMRECTSLDQNRCSELIYQWITESDEGRRVYNTMMWCPGSELSPMMIHRNNNGSSLSFSFKLLQDVVEHELGFYVCVVLDRERFAVICRGNFMDECAHKIDLERYEIYHGSETFVKSSKHPEEFQLLRGSTDLDVIIQSEHVLVEPIHFRSQNFEKDRTFTVEFQFQCLSTDLALVDEDGDHLWSSDGITKCAVYPLFHH